MNTPRNRRRLLALLLLLLLLLGSGLAGYAWPDRKLAAAKAMRKELFSPAARALPGEERRAKWHAPCARRRSSSRRRSGGSYPRRSRKRRQAEMAKYFRMSQADKTRFLDEQIRRMQRAGAAGGRVRRRQGRCQRRAGAGRPDGGSRGDRPAERDERRRERLDSTTPAERAQMTQFFRDLSARRSQLGMPMGGGPGPGR